MSMDSYKITSGEVDNVHVEAQGTRLTGTVLQNKQVFDHYPDLIKDKFNALCDYIDSYMPTGDVGVSYTQTEINFICTVLGCSEADITI